jgi:hypothetical protein
MNAAELDRLRNERQHMTPREDERGHRDCWCGLCHCHKCQAKRQQSLTIDHTTNRHIAALDGAGNRGEK